MKQLLALGTLPLSASPTYSLEYRDPKNEIIESYVIGHF